MPINFLQKIRDCWENNIQIKSLKYVKERQQNPRITTGFLGSPFYSAIQLYLMISKDVEGNEYIVTASDLAWRPSAYGIVIRENKILLVKENGKFHLPGGGIDLGENPKEAVIREVREETGIAVANPRILNAESSFFTWQSIDQPPKLEHVHSILLYYACDYIGGSLGDVLLDEYEKLAGLTPEWLDVAKLPNVPVGTTVDWRIIVRQSVQAQSHKAGKDN